MKTTLNRCALATAVAGLCLSSAMTHASSHREAPFITEKPKVDGTDFYMFRSYEDTRRGGDGDNGFVTMIANYQPLQDAYGGPNYFDMDDEAIYEIHIDRDADGQEELTFQFDFTNVNQDLTLEIGPDGNTKTVSTPLKNIGGIGPGATDGDGVIATRQEYTLKVIQGDRRTGAVSTATNETTGTTSFRKPVDNIGSKTFPDGYGTYADNFVYEFSVSNCPQNGKVFVGQRQDAFAISLGEIFDLGNLDMPLTGDRDRGRNDLADKNVTSIAVEYPTDCLTSTASQNASGQNVIGGWTTASIPQAEIINPEPTDKNFDSSAAGQSASIRGGAFTQVSRVGMPLTNEVVIGLKDKDTFNHSEPSGDGQFIDYATNPTLPKLLEIVTGGAVVEPPVFPRVDLIATFLTGVTLRDPNSGDVLFSNEPVDVTASEMLRLNTAVAPASFANQEDQGLLVLDAAGFPNGRRPGDDVVDIALRATTGEILPFFRDSNGDPFMNPNDGDQLRDGAVVRADLLLDDPSNNETPVNHRFPYLAHPLAGSPFGSN